MYVLQVPVRPRHRLAGVRVRGLREQRRVGRVGRDRQLHGLPVGRLSAALIKVDLWHLYSGLYSLSLAHPYSWL